MTDERTDRDTVAAELAMGLLSGPELRAATALARSDAAFAQQVARWRGRLAPLVDAVDEVVPPDAVWIRVEKSVDVGSDSNVIALRRKVNVWRGLTGAMTALAASLALVTVNREVPPPPVSAPAARPLVAIIKAGGDVAAVVNWDKSSRGLLLSEVKMPVVPSHDYQLWLIPADGRPRSVGVMPNAPVTRLALAPRLSRMLAEGATLAVSLEPLGGSPTDAPSGPVVASGALAVA